MTFSRPDPDKLLARAKAEEERARRGRLKVFFGFAPGVGKTYAMLQDARGRRAEGVDVVAGVIETHSRAETEALLAGMEVIPRRDVPYHGITLREFDLDAVLARRPILVLVDELAHTNAPGSRHPKRWRDVEELLAAGIDVHTTVNVQHLESLSDVVAQITGAVVRETVPDTVLERADEIELVDLPPEQLLERLKEGKVYLGEQAGRAIDGFFRKGNLIALRELSLRRIAERVAEQMVNYRRDQAIERVWPAADRLLVAVGPSPSSARLVRATKRMAENQHAQWFAISVETPAHTRLSAEDKDRIAQTLRLAESLGAQTATISGDRTSDAILKFAREHNITKIVAGKPIRRRVRDRLFGSIVDEMIWNCGEIDVFVISGEGEETRMRPRRAPAAASTRAADVIWPVGIVTVASGLAWLMSRTLSPANLIMIYLLAVVVTAVTRGRKASVIATFLSVGVFDFFFVPPYLTFVVSNSEFVVTFAVMLLVGLLISDLTARVRAHAESSSLREQTTWAFFDLSRSLGGAHGRDEIVRIATEHSERVLRGRVAVLFSNAEGNIVDDGAQLAPNRDRERGVAQWVFDHGEPGGMGADTLSGAEALYLPIRVGERTLGVFRLKPETPIQVLSPDRLRFISTLTNQIAQALERERLTDQAHIAQMGIEAERMRNVLLSSVSHDLRTPLTAITAAASSLIDSPQPLDEKTRREFESTIYDEGRRLDRLVADLLEMSRLESGSLRPDRDWQSVEEVIGVSLNRLESQLDGREVTIQAEPDLPFVKMDDLLMEQVFANLIENAIKHTPSGTPIDIGARRGGGEVRIEIADRGPGISPGEEERIFEKFYQAADSKHGRGVGLGLAICRSLVELHGGRIRAANRAGGGAVFSFTLPLDEEAPALDNLYGGKPDEAAS